MQVLSGAPATLPAGMYAKVARYRHQVFVECLGWALRSEGGGEVDQFDRSDTVYVAAQDEEDRIVGCARLLPTTRPYLLGEVFPQLLNGLPVPRAPEVWELSRFAAVDFSSQGGTGAGQFSSPVAVGLLTEAVRCAARHGATRMITVSPLGVERLLRRAGFHARRAGPPMVIEGHPIFACWIEVREPDPVARPDT